jgi:hypothetical protein
LRNWEALTELESSVTKWQKEISGGCAKKYLTILTQSDIMKFK